MSLQNYVSSAGFDITTFVLNNANERRYHSEPNGIVCIDGDTGATMSFRALESMVDGVAFGLIDRLGLSRGDVVAICSPSTLQYPALALATLRAGCIATFINFKSSQSELQEHLKNTNAKAVIAHHKLLYKVSLAVREAGINISAGRIVSMSPIPMTPANPCLLDILSTKPLNQATQEPLSMSLVQNSTAIVNYSPSLDKSQKSENEAISHGTIVSALSKALEMQKGTNESSGELNNQHIVLNFSALNQISIPSADEPKRHGLIETILFELCSGKQIIISQMCSFGSVRGLAARYNIHKLYIEAQDEGSPEFSTNKVILCPYKYTPYLSTASQTKLSSAGRDNSTNELSQEPKRTLICTDVYRSRL
ncbi:hypothetical protein H4219_001453 [Mycoemilia scoparia]|uniref:AMP-dependent synthetase/ligase domain-containing protein n=1 Tax=Mycoemilia scoparia TaxID=417184 RepID=A0A9W8A047_9FUNG|nr:hypothetical protein H4219_001453 [Mycoemilia scoparia]